MTHAMRPVETAETFISRVVMTATLEQETAAISPLVTSLEALIVPTNT